MKTSKELVYEFIQKQTYSKQETSLSTKYISEALAMQRSNVSSLLNELVKDGVLDKSETRPVMYSLSHTDEPEELLFSFERLIGHDGSLKNAIHLAKAAMLYPDSGLSVLISSQTGCGTSSFVYTMLDYAKEQKVFSKDAPVAKINCRNYAKNIASLSDELFGKDNDLTTSIFYKAKGGMLFLDNIDFLDAKQHNRLLDFLDTQTLFSEDRSVSMRFDDTMVVIGCSPQSEAQFSRKIPVIINLPTLIDRPMEERLELIHHFFTKEATHSDSVINVTVDVLKALLMCDFTYNIKELFFEIKAACAKAYVRSVNDKDSDINVYISDFKSNVRKSLLKEKDLTSFVYNELRAIDIKSYFQTHNAKDAKHYNESEDVYLAIKKQYDELSDRGINENSIGDVIDSHVQYLFRRYRYYNVYEKNSGLEQLSKIVDERIIRYVDEFMETCRKKLNIEFKSSLFYGLCLHINSLLTLKEWNQRIDNNQIADFIQKYPQEYALSAQFCDQLKTDLSIDLPIEEVTIIAMFLIDSDEEESEGNPVVLYILHGNSAATSLKDVTNALTQSNNAYGYDLRLDTETEQALVEIRQLIERIDEGKGVIVIYDMGSIKTMIDTISEEIDVKIRTMNVPITLIGIDTARKSSMSKDIDYTYHLANLEMNRLSRNQEKYTDIIVTLCHTGEGGALQMERYINQYSKLGFKVVPLAISEREKLVKEVMDLQRTYKIHAFVGTYDPKLYGIPFISIGRIFENSQENLDRILLFEPVNNQNIDYSSVYQYLEEQFRYVSIPKLKAVLPDVLDELDIFYMSNPDQRVGMFMHLACLVERLLEGEIITENSEKNKVLSVFKDEYVAVRKILKRLEKAFNIIIDDNELATIIMIIKKI